MDKTSFPNKPFYIYTSFITFSRFLHTKRNKNAKHNTTTLPGPLRTTPTIFRTRKKFRNDYLNVNRRGNAISLDAACVGKLFTNCHMSNIRRACDQINDTEINTHTELTATKSREAHRWRLPLGRSTFAIFPRKTGKGASRARKSRPRAGNYGFRRRRSWFCRRFHVWKASMDFGFRFSPVLRNRSGSDRWKFGSESVKVWARVRTSERADEMNGTGVWERTPVCCCFQFFCYGKFC